MSDSAFTPIDPPRHPTPTGAKHGGTAEDELQQMVVTVAREVARDSEFHGQVDSEELQRVLQVARSAYQAESLVWQSEKNELDVLGRARYHALNLRILQVAITICAVVATLNLASGMTPLNFVPPLRIAGTAPATTSLLLGAVVVVALVPLFVLRQRDLVRRGIKERVDSARLQLYAKLRQEARARASEVLNRANREALAARVLDVTDAPRLVEVKASDAIASRSLSRVRAFIQDHETSAIGLSGPRGVGKTTIIRAICGSSSEGTLGVAVSVPVRYAPEDFLRLLHTRIAEAGLAGADIRRRQPRLSPIILLRLAAAAILGMAGSFLLAGGTLTTILTSQRVLGVTLLGVAAVLYFLTLITLQRRRRLLWMKRDVAGLCERELERLRWSATWQHSAKNTFTFGALGIEDQEQRELAERPQSHPEAVAALRDFITRYSDLTGKSIYVGIDELDKMTEGADALQFINDIKDILHMPGCHFVVSVSVDALESFTLRGVPVRDAFDSAFDTIVSVDRLSVQESRNLLSRRVVRLPDVLTCLAHGVAGGLPRDVIRCARACVDVRRMRDKAVPTDLVVHEVLADYSTSVLEVVLARSRDTPTELRWVVLHGARAIRRSESASDLSAAFDECAASLRAHDPTGRWTPGIPGLLTAYAILASAFGGPFSDEEWEAALDTGQAYDIGGAVAEAVACLATTPEEALVDLSGLRAEQLQRSEGSQKPEPAPLARRPRVP